MNTLKIKSLRFDANFEILFKQGMNYIHGLNGSGKTTVFNTLQYLLGLKKELGFFVSYKSEEISAVFEVNGQIVNFQRELNTGKITVNTDYEELKLTLNSPAYFSFFNRLFKPQYNFEINDSMIASLIREAFVSGSNFDKEFSSNIFYKEITLLKLGVNTIYPKKIKSYLKELKLDIEQKEKAFEQIKSYKQDIEFLFNRELNVSKEVIADITNSTLQKYSQSLNEASQLADQTNTLLQRLTLDNENILKGKIDMLDDIFKRNLKLVMEEDRISIYDLVEGHGIGASYSKRSLIHLIFNITIQTNNGITNGMGFLINDSALSNLEEHLKSNFRELVKNVCKEDSNFQYIEFTYDTQGIDRNDIIYDLGKGLKYV